MTHKLLKSGMSVLDRNGKGVIVIFKNPFCGFPLLFGTIRRIHAYMLRPQVELECVQYILCRKSLSVSTVLTRTFPFVITCYSNRYAGSKTRVCISNNLYCVYFVCVLMAAKGSSTDYRQTRERISVR